MCADISEFHVKNMTAVTEIDFKVSYCVVLYCSVHHFKASYYRPGRAFRAAGSGGSLNSLTTAREGGEELRTGRLYPSGGIPDTPLC